MFTIKRSPDASLKSGDFLSMNARAALNYSRYKIHSQRLNA